MGDIVFNKKWFDKYQKQLLWLANTPIIKIWFRSILRIRKSDLPLSKKIDEISPNSFTYNKCLVQVPFLVSKKTGEKIAFNKKNRNHIRLLRKKSFEIEYKWCIKRTTDFRTHEKFGKRLYHAFKWIWSVIHFYDWIFADRFAPALRFGFSTLTQYPEPGTTADGRVMRLSVDETWANICTGNGTSNNDDYLFAGCTASTTTDQFLELLRGICNFDISTIGSGSIINSATLSLWGETNRTGLGSGWEVGIVESDSASDDTLDNGDFQTMSKTDFATRIAQSSWNTGSYNVFTLNSSGESYLDTKKTGIAKLGCMLDWDIDGSFGGSWSNSQDSGSRISSADHTGTTQDPKLIIDYTEPTLKDVSDSGSGADSIDALSAQLDLSDSGSGADSMSDLLAQLDLPDTASGSDILLALRAQLDLSDVGSGADLISLLQASLDLSDNGSGIDALSILVQLALSDSGNGNDALAMLISLILNDTGNGAEAINILVQIALSDSGSGADALILLIALSLTDAGSGIDIQQILAQIDLSDSGVGSDLINFTNRICLLDVGLGSEAISILNQLVLADSGVAVDSPIIYAIINKQEDSGIGADAVNLLIEISLSDSGVGAEALNTLISFCAQDSGVGQDIIDIITRTYPYLKRQTPYNKLR